MKRQLEKEIKLRNFEEHYSQLLKDIEYYDTELNKKKDIYNEFISKIDKIQKLIDDKSLELKTIEEKCVQSLYVTEKKMREIELDISNKIKELDIYTKNSKNIVDKNNKKASEIEKTILKNQSEKDKLNSELNVLKNLILDNSNLFAEQSANNLKTLKEQDNKILELNNSIETIKTKETIVKNNISELEDEYNYKLNFVKEANDLVKHREKIIQKREKDFQVIYKRLNKKFKEQNPGLILKI